MLGRLVTHTRSPCIALIAVCLHAVVPAWNSLHAVNPEVRPYLRLQSPVRSYSRQHDGPLLQPTTDDLQVFEYASGWPLACLLAGLAGCKIAWFTADRSSSTGIRHRARAFRESLCGNVRFAGEHHPLCSKPSTLDAHCIHTQWMQSMCTLCDAPSLAAAC